ncbi:sigma-70 family RNA polymerase sigma factor [Bacillus sp. Marseille-Q3570]|uniref:sigma-70 family RNA polymerase sigma factor n=1 Tax=Bacillus sp. Marseille-Q3570 TaxID=2963522 RepID=UPI0021B6F469|nr:sigma-70 family RNA polymerase sigma factor [Bacillus sp. Marseille-Q3570]
MLHIQLVKKAIKGDDKAFESLIQQDSDKLYRTAFLYVRNKEDALDLLQETVCKAYVAINKLKNPEYFSTWITKILMNTAYEFLNKKKRILLTGDAFFEAIANQSPSNVEDHIDLVKAISELKEDYQSVIILFYYQDRSIHDIAKIMDRPEGTIKTYLHRAKFELNKALKGVPIHEQRLV